MKKHASLLLLFAGFWLLGVIASPRLTEFTRTDTITYVSSAVMAGLIAAGLTFRDRGWFR